MIQVNEVRTPDRVFILQVTEADLRVMLSAAVLAWNAGPNFDSGRRLADKLHAHLDNVRRIAADHKVGEL